MTDRSPKPFESAHDVNLRLVNSVMLFEGRPVYVGHGPGEGSVNITDNPVLDNNTKYTPVSANDIRFDLKAPQLGMTIAAENKGLPLVAYITKAVGSNKVGVAHDGMLIEKFGRRFYIVLEERMDYSGVFQTIRGDWPDWHESVLRGGDGVIDRQFGLVKVNGTHCLAFRNELIGVYEPKKNSVVLQKRFQVPSVMAYLSNKMEIQREIVERDV